MPTDIRKFLLQQQTPTYAAYYNGKMSYRLHSRSWESYVTEAFPNIKDQNTSENIFKDVLDLYAENLIPVIPELRDFTSSLIPLLSRGECPVVVDNAGIPHFPEHFEMISDGQYSVVAVFSRSLAKLKDYVTFIWSDGSGELWSKDIPQDMGPATREGYQFVESTYGNTLYRFSLRDKGFGPSLSALQDRANHSILDQTVIAEMYARPFWYLLNTDIPMKNPYLPKPAHDDSPLQEQEGLGSASRVFVTSSEGPFGQLTPPTISDMISYHDSIIAKISQSTGIPGFYLNPGDTVPSGVALKVLSKRFNNTIARIRDDIEPQLMQLATQLGVAPTAGEDLQLWPSSDDLLQEALDTHGLALAGMGYPLPYIAEVVTPGVDLDDFQDDGYDESLQLSTDQIARA